MNQIHPHINILLIASNITGLTLYCSKEIK